LRQWLRRGPEETAALGPPVWAAHRRVKRVTRLAELSQVF
jgi:hypothetical protein